MEEAYRVWRCRECYEDRDKGLQGARVPRKESMTALWCNNCEGFEVHNTRWSDTPLPITLTDEYLRHCIYKETEMGLFDSVETYNDLQNMDQKLVVNGIAMNKHDAPVITLNPKTGRSTIAISVASVERPGESGLDFLPMHAGGLWKFLRINKALGFKKADIDAHFEGREDEVTASSMPHDCIEKVIAMWEGKEGWAAVKPRGERNQIDWYSEGEPVQIQHYGSGSSGNSGGSDSGDLI